MTRPQASLPEAKRSRHGMIADLWFSVPKGCEDRRYRRRGQSRRPLPGWPYIGDSPMRGNFLLQGWKNMHPEQHHIQGHIDLHTSTSTISLISPKKRSRAGMKIRSTFPDVGIFRPSLSFSKRTGSLRKNLPDRAENSIDATSLVQPTCLAGPADDIATPEQVVNAAHCIWNAEGSHRSGGGAGRPYRVVRGWADAEGALATDRSLDRGPIAAAHAPCPPGTGF
jgi:hypothetical protein